MGVDPGPWTLRDLMVMYTGRRREDWSHTANQMALFANANRDPKKGRAFQLHDFLPQDLRRFARRASGIALTPQGLRAMKKLFTEAN